MRDRPASGTAYKDFEFDGSEPLDIAGAPAVP
jgi:hypothetical protein